MIGDPFILNVDGNPVGTFELPVSGMDFVIELTRGATPAAVSTVLQALGVSSTNENPSGTPQEFKITVTDSEGGSTTATTTVQIDPQNDAPINTVPGAPLTVDEGDPISMQMVEVNDVDAGMTFVDLTLSANVSGWFLLGSSGLGAPVRFIGPAAHINATLDMLTFQPIDPNFNGVVTFTVNSNDDGGSGAGGPQTDMDTFDVTVTAIDDQPIIANTAADTITDKVSDTPFSAVTFTEDDGEDIAVSIQISIISNGAFSNLGGFMESGRRPLHPRQHLCRCSSGGDSRHRFHPGRKPGRSRRLGGHHLHHHRRG